MKNKPTTLILGVSLMIFSFTSGLYGQWERVPPPGPVVALAANDACVFTVAKTGRVFRSTNLGSTWENVGTGLPFIDDVKCNGSAVFANDNKYLYRSTDYGNVWMIKNTVPNHLSEYRPTLCDLTVSGGSLFLINTYDLIEENYVSWRMTTFRSDDNGETWTGFNGCCSFAKRGSDLFVAGTGVFMLTQGRLDTVSAGLPAPYSISLFTCGNEVFACPRDSGIYRLVIDDTSWVEADAGLENKSVNCMIGSGAVVFAGTKGGVFHSTDSGINWIAANSGFEANRGVATLAATDDHLFALIDSGLWRLPLAVFPGGTVRDDAGKGVASFSVSRTGTDLCLDFSIPRTELVMVAIYDLSGRETAKIVDRQFDAGSYRLNWEFRNLMSGCYMARIQAGGKVFTERVPLFR